MILEKFIDYLRTELKNSNIDYQSTPKQLQGGYETTIYRFQLIGTAAEYAQPMVLRLYPEFYGPHNALWESTIQNVLAESGFPVAKVHFVCSDMSVLGGAFYVMDYLPGWPLMFANATVWGDNMAKAASADYDATQDLRSNMNLADSILGSPRSEVASQLHP